MTRRPILFAVPFALVVAVSFVSAQAPPISRTPPHTMGDQVRRPSPQLTIPKNSRGITASGCLKLERDVASRPEVTEAGGGSGNGYVLIGAKLKGDGVATGGQEATAELYRVAGLSESKLRDHVNRQVELKGRLNLGRVSTPEQTDAKSSSDGGDGTNEVKGLPAITANSIKTLADACEAGSN